VIQIKGYDLVKYEETETEIEKTREYEETNTHTYRHPYDSPSA